MKPIRPDAAAADDVAGSRPPLKPPGLPDFGAQASGSADSQAIPDSPLAHAFALRLLRLARSLGVAETHLVWLERAALALTRDNEQGHVCTPLAALCRRYQASLDVVRASLLATPLVGSTLAAAFEAPLILDAGDRLYLSRLFEHECRLAESIIEMSGPTPGRSPGSTQALREALTRHFGHTGGDAAATAAEGAPDWQQVAALLALRSRLIVVSGGPGTGKTTTVAGMLSMLLESGARGERLRIALAAPTGKAAQRMQEALAERATQLAPAMAARLPSSAHTLHRLLGGASKHGFRYNRLAPLPYDVVVVDEASMIDLAMARHLLDAIGEHTQLILLGDKDQLSAVEAGAVFAVLSRAPHLSTPTRDWLAGVLGLQAARLRQGAPALGDRADRTSVPADPVLEDQVVWLERNYRFGLESPIGRLASAVREGDVDTALASLESLAPGGSAGSAGSGLAMERDGSRAARFWRDTGERLQPATVRRLAAGFEPYRAALAAAVRGWRNNAAAIDPAPLFQALNAHRILCPSRHGPRGAHALNAMMTQALMEALMEAHGAGVPAAAQEEPAGTSAPPAWGSAGAAHWFIGRAVMISQNDYALGLYNGDVGIALPSASGAFRVSFAQSTGGYRTLSPAALPAHETAFAMTVHKSQGSEFLHASLVLPAHFSALLSRELVYTAITRARTEVEIIGDESVLERAIGISSARASGLDARLVEARVRAGNRAGK